MKGCQNQSGKFWVYPAKPELSTSVVKAAARLEVCQMKAVETCADLDEVEEDYLYPTEGAQQMFTTVATSFLFAAN